MRDKYDEPINPYDLSHVAAVRKGTLYPTPREPHSAADLLRPLAADNARLRDEVDRLTAMNEVLRIALKQALERERALERVPR